MGLLKRAANGEEVGIIHHGKIIALIPIPRAGEGYASREYGVTEAELDRFVRGINTRIARERRAGKITTFSGDIEADIFN